jgi:hypothetical protein
MHMYKLCRRSPKTGGVRALFHATAHGTREFPVGKWLMATDRTVQDGRGTPYRSGFHMLPTPEACREYLKKFKDTSDIVIARCWTAGERWPKAHSPSPVTLCQQIYVLDFFEPEVACGVY